MPDTKVTKEKIDDMVRGIVMQLQSTCVAKNYSSFSEAMEDLGLWNFVNNQAEVIAYAHQANMDMYNIIRAVGKPMDTIERALTDPFTWRNPTFGTEYDKEKNLGNFDNKK